MRCFIVVLTLFLGISVNAQKLDTAAIDEALGKVHSNYRDAKLYNHLSDSLYKILKGTEQNQRLAKALKFKGISNYQRGNWDSSMYFYEKSLTIQQNFRDSLEIGKLLVNIATTYTAKHEYEKAISYALKSKRVFEAIGDVRGVNYSNNLLASFHYYKKEFELALEYFRENYHSTIDLKDTLENVVALNNMGATFQELKLPDSTIACALKVLKLGEYIQLPNPGYPYQNLGLAYFEKGEFKEALKYFLKSKSEYQKVGRAGAFAESYYNVAVCYKNLGDEKNAFLYFDLALKHSQKQGEKNVEKITLRKLAEMYHEKGQGIKAYELMVEYQELSEEILNEANQESILELQTAYDVEKKEEQIKLQNQVLETQKAQIKSRTYAIIALLLFAVFVFTIALWWNSKEKRRQESLLQQQEIDFKNRQLEASITSQETERKRFAKDLHDGFGQVISVLSTLR